MSDLIDREHVIDFLKLTRDSEYEKSMSAEVKHKSVIRSKHDAHVAFCDYLIEYVNQVPTHPTPSNTLDISVCIDKQAVIDQINRLINDKHHIKIGTSTFRDGVIDGYARVLSMVKNMPSAQPDVPDTNVGELISRQAAIDALDILCQEHRYKIPGKAETYSQYNEAWQDALDRAEGAIGDLPSVQPEIIRCKDCKYAEAADLEDSQDGYTCQFHRGSIWFSGSYCSWAELRGDSE